MRQCELKQCNKTYPFKQKLKTIHSFAKTIRNHSLFDWKIKPIINHFDIWLI
jgi:hypothetical protein